MECGQYLDSLCTALPERDTLVTTMSVQIGTLVEIMNAMSLQFGVSAWRIWEVVKYIENSLLL